MIFGDVNESDSPVNTSILLFEMPFTITPSL